MTLEEAVRKLEEALKQIEELREENRQLREENKKLRRDIEEWKRGHRQRRARFSSRQEGKAKRAEAKKPGRKTGHAANHRAKPSDVNETVEYPVPQTCECGGCLEATGTHAEVIVEDIPPIEPERTRHIAHEGKCQRCGKIRRAKLPGAPDSGKPIADVILGERALGLAVSLRFEHRVPLRHIGDVFGSFFGLNVSAGGLSHAMVRTAERNAPVLTEIRAHIRDAAVVGGDETSWRQNGDGYWMWILRTPQASLFRIAPHRDAETFDSFLPRGFVGVLVTDCYGVYTRRFDILHAYCGAHVVREAKKIAEVEPTPQATAFAFDLRWLYRRAEVAREAQDHDTLESLRRRFHFLATNERYKGHDDVEALQARILKYEAGFTMFLGRNDIPWHNNDTERDVRPACILRKIVGQTRSDRGANALGTWMSTTQTLRKNRIPFGPWFALSVGNYRNGLPPPTVFAPPSPPLRIASA